jgi:N-glycosylase/DNA lyase
MNRSLTQPTERRPPGLRGPRPGKCADLENGAPASQARGPQGTHSTFFAVGDYDLATTLSSGQAFRWRPHGTGWVGVIGSHWVKLTSQAEGILAETVEPVFDWSWLGDYLQVKVDLVEILASFPDDPPMRAAVAACRGLRLLRQDLWECLASFILSSTKQIVQIQQIVSSLCECFGKPVRVPPGYGRTWAFPSANRLAQTTEMELRACKMGFRAPYLLGTARAIDSGEFDLEKLRHLEVQEARAQLMQLPGVGRKIADCVLLFAYGQQAAFPVDVWVIKALRHLYFAGRRVTPAKLHRFAATHFGPYAGYAQQYLFHHVRTQPKALRDVQEFPNALL